MVKWNLICAKNMLHAKMNKDWMSYYYWESMFLS